MILIKYNVILPEQMDVWL